MVKSAVSAYSTTIPGNGPFSPFALRLRRFAASLRVTKDVRFAQGFRVFALRHARFAQDDTGLLLVVFDDLFLAHVCDAGVLAGIAARPALA